MRRRGKAVDSRVICFVTIHGIGFQHPPLDGIPGYADSLLANICRVLNQIGNLLLSDDPDLRPDEVGESVPIDVQSVWPLDSLHIEAGLKRLGSWDEDHMRVSGADLVKDNAHIAHVALVYSKLEGEGPLVGASAMAGVMTTISVRHYSHVKGLLDMTYVDIIRPSIQSFCTNLFILCWLPRTTVLKREGVHPRISLVRSVPFPPASQGLATCRKARIGQITTAIPLFARCDPPFVQV
jgi:hypothetical protein